MKHWEHDPQMRAVQEALTTIELWSNRSHRLTRIIRRELQALYEQQAEARRGSRRRAPRTKDRAAQDL